MMERTGCFDNTSIITNPEQSMQDKDSIENLQADFEMRDDMDDGHGDESYGEQKYDTIQDGEQSSPHNESQSYNWNTSIDTLLKNLMTVSQRKRVVKMTMWMSNKIVSNDVSDTDVPLYPGATITLKVTMILLLTFVVCHNLSNEAISDLLYITELICPKPNLC